MQVMAKPELRNNVIDLLLRDKRSENTKRAYRWDLKDFFLTSTGQEPTGELVEKFLSLARTQAVAVVIEYKAHLINKGLAEATINRRLAAIKSLVNYARKIGRCSWDLQDVEGEKVQGYRDTTGPTTDEVVKMLSTLDRETHKGKRDYAILRLLWSNALRRGEVVSCDVKDFDRESGTLAIKGKGKGTQKEIITLKQKAVKALTEYLDTREAQPGEPLFTALDNKNKGHKLTGQAIAYIIQSTAREAGIKKKVTPHRIRHSSITAALEATNGNVSMVQKLSRHVKVETVMVYNDRRTDQQGEVSDLLEKIA